MTGDTPAGAAMPSVDERIAAVLADPACSYWLQDALSAAIKRDPVDAVDDAELMLDLLAERAETIIDAGLMVDASKDRTW